MSDLLLLLNYFKRTSYHISCGLSYCSSQHVMIRRIYVLKFFCKLKFKEIISAKEYRSEWECTKKL